jgi:hypothetical protein
VKVTIASINMVDVHVATIRSKTTKVYTFKEHEPKNNKSAIDWEGKKHVKKSMVETT